MIARGRLTFAVTVALLLSVSAPAAAGADSSTTTTTVATATTTRTTAATTTTITKTISPIASARVVKQVIVSGFSETGDYILNGVSSVYSGRWQKVSATTSGIYLSYVNPANKRFATFSFDPVAGSTLRVGNYDNLQRAAYRSAGFAGIEVTGPGQPAGCPRVTGGFRVWDIASNTHGVITRLDLTYVEHCAYGRPANYGEVLINDAPIVGVLYASARRIAFPDQSPRLPYVLTNPTSQSQSVSLGQSTTTVSHFKVNPVVGSCAAVVPAKSSCAYLLTLVPPKPGFYTSTVLVNSRGTTIRLPLTGSTGGP